MLLRVQYPDSGYDYVNAAVLNRLINSRRIKKFFRPLENKWVDIEEGPIREETIVYTNNVYIGPERRRTSSVS